MVYVGNGTRGWKVGSWGGLCWNPQEALGKERNAGMWGSRGGMQSCPTTVSIFFPLYSSKYVTCRSHFTYLNFSTRYHVVVQETNEEQRMVNKNLTEIFSYAADHLVTVEVCDDFCLQLPVLTWCVLHEVEHLVTWREIQIQFLKKLHVFELYHCLSEYSILIGWKVSVKVPITPRMITIKVPILTSTPINNKVLFISRACCSSAALKARDL